MAEENAGPANEPAADPTAEIDQLIRAEDPHFEKSLKDIEALKNEQINLDDESVEIEEDLLNQEKAPEFIENQKLTGLKKIKQNIRYRLRQMRYWIADIPRNAIPFAKRLLVGFFRVTFSAIKAAAHATSEFVDYLYNLSGFEKLIVLGIVVITGLIIYLVQFAVQGQQLPISSDRYLRSYADVANHVYQVAPEEKYADFFNVFTEPQFFVLMGKMFVNLRPSAHSSSNPMGAFRLFLEGSSQEVAVEIKDRQKELRDVIQTTLESVSYDQLRTPEGKAHVKSLIRQQVNQVLNEGQVRRVLFDTIVLKP